MDNPEVAERFTHGRWGADPFPREWGAVPFDYEQRAAWAADHIRAGQARLDRGERVTWMRARAPKQMLAALLNRSESPAFLNAIRLRLLELRRRMWL